ncbi:hypothetical protein EB796_004986 [Bugula neritina]|uniref:Uncharacterized protein n=1 Tax=Bugula neritina TaxID=10212 RepID=A0A7J7KFK9_BUGNE|nr:hypothetical protein EB796_004986 [Bugula neritina]
MSLDIIAAYCSYAMTSSSGDCSAGYYCKYGVDRHQPEGINETCTPYGNMTGVGGPCWTGHYCPAGRAQTFDLYPCPPGYFCPPLTTRADQYPCPSGTFYNTTGARNESDCLPCTLGSYCELDGLSEPSGLCSPGWYCNGSSTSSTPTLNGGECQPRTFCPEGSHQPTPCTPGMYCQVQGLFSPSGNCTPGYYCSLSADTSTPTDGITGDQCPLGHFCPLGSASPIPCDQGYYLNTTQQV